MASFDFEREFFQTEGIRLLVLDPKAFPLGVSSYRCTHGSKGVDVNDPQYAEKVAMRIADIIGLNVELAFISTSSEDNRAGAITEAFGNLTSQ